MIKILIVEDDDNKKEDLVAFFYEHGIFGPSLFVVSDVSSALAQIRKTRFDIICLDLNLPIRSGEPETEDGGRSILYKLSSPQYKTPGYIFGLTSFNSIKQSQGREFKNVDFNLYDYNNDEWRGIISRKIDWIKMSHDDSGERESPNEIFIFVHGIMTLGKWQDLISFKLNDDNKKERKLISYKYNFYSFFKILLNGFRSRQLNHFKVFLENVLIENPDSKINIISHSFGTYLTVNALEQLKLDNLTRINYIILSGSVLRNDHDLSKIVKKFGVKKLINDCGINDVPLVLSKLFCFGLGHAGRIGFNSSVDEVENRYFRSGHSVFDDVNDFFDKYWIDIFNKDEVKLVDERNFSKFDEFKEQIVNILNPYITYPLLLMLIWVLMFY